MSKDQTDIDRFGPADVVCPYCGEEVHVEAGPTKLCEIDHCGEWMIVDLEDESAGHTNSDALRADGGKVEHEEFATPSDGFWCDNCEWILPAYSRGDLSLCPGCTDKYDAVVDSKYAVEPVSVEEVI